MFELVTPPGPSEMQLIDEYMASRKGLPVVRIDATHEYSEAKVRAVVSRAISELSAKRRERDAANATRVPEGVPLD